jgi:hypothetical protein
MLRKTLEWRKLCAKAYMDMAYTTRSARQEEIRRLYDYYNGVIDEQDYRYVLKPYGKTRTNFPSKMRNYPIIKNIIDILKGEKSKRPFNYTVIVQNSDSVSKKEEALKEFALGQMKQEYANALNASGEDTGVPSKEQAPLPEAVSEFEGRYVDERAVLGQKGMNFIVQDCEVEDKIQKAWFHFLVAGECFSERGVLNGEPFYEILNPLDMDYDLDPDRDYVEDGDWAMITRYMHPSTVLELYSKELTKEQISNLETSQYNHIGSLDLYDPQRRQRDRLVKVRTVYWKGLKRTGFLKYVDPETGEEVVEEVEDGFKMSPMFKELGASVEWEWDNEVWQGRCFNEEDYFSIRPCDYQRLDPDNASKGKLPINGRRYSDINTENTSLVRLGIPFQLMYNVYKYRLELAVARSKDVIAQLDINLIPKKWDLDKFMYYVEGTGIAWVDYNKEGVKLSPNHQSILDLTVKTIDMYTHLLDHIYMEWERVSGVNKQRQGDVGQYEGKATSQQAIVQSSHTTEDLYRKFGGFERRDLTALLDYSKQAWPEGKSTSFVMPDGTVEFLSIHPLEWMECVFGIFMSDSSKEQEKLDSLRQLSLEFAQNGVRPSTIADIFDADSFQHLKKVLRTAESEIQELEQQAAQAEQQIKEADLAEKQADRDSANMNKELDRRNKIEVAQIAHSDKGEASPDVPEDDSIKREEVSLKKESQAETKRHNLATEAIQRMQKKEASKGKK